MDLVKKYLPLAAFLAFLTKNMIIAPSFPDSIILGCLVAYIILDNLRLRASEIDNLHQRFKNNEDIIKKQQEDIGKLQTAISSMRISTGLRAPSVKSSTEKSF